MEFKIGNDTFVLEDEMTMKQMRKTENAFLLMQKDPFEATILILKAMLVSFNGEYNIEAMENRINSYNFFDSTKLLEEVLKAIGNTQEKTKKK